jgi:membrane protease YdiL (CAAX protease family)
MGAHAVFAFLVVYVVFLLFAYWADPRFSLKYKKIPSFYYLFYISLLGTAVLLLPLVLSTFFFGGNIITSFGTEDISLAWYDILVGLLVGIVLLLLLIILQALISVVRRKFFPNYKSRREEEVQKLILGSLPSSRVKMLTMLSITSLKAAIFEELTFRGYLLSNLLLLFSPALAIIVQAVFFFVIHLYQGIFNAIAPLIYGIMLGLIFFLTGSLTIVIIAHFSGDVIALTVQAMTMKKDKALPQPTKTKLQSKRNVSPCF